MHRGTLLLVCAAMPELAACGAERLREVERSEVTEVTVLPPLPVETAPCDLTCIAPPGTCVGAGTCELTDGVAGCKFSIASNGTSCRLPAGANGVCQAGVCAACTSDTQCNDLDPCTTDTCFAGGCIHTGECAPPTCGEVADLDGCADTMAGGCKTNGRCESGACAYDLAADGSACTLLGGVQPGVCAAGACRERPDTVTYSTTRSEGPDPTELNAWYSDFVYGVPTSPLACSTFSFESQRVESWPLRIVTGIHGNASNTVGQGYGQPVRDLDLQPVGAPSGATGWSLRFAPLQGVTAFRVKTNDSGTFEFNLFQGGGAGFIYWDADLGQYVNKGLVMTISRRPCDNRETDPAQVIHTDEYCTFQNSFTGPPTDLYGYGKVSSGSSTSAVCNLQPNVYYYVNVLKLNEHAQLDTFVLGIRAQ